MNGQLRLFSGLSWSLVHVSPLSGLKTNTAGHQSLGKLIGLSNELGSRLALIRSTNALG